MIDLTDRWSVGQSSTNRQRKPFWNEAILPQVSSTQWNSYINLTNARTDWKSTVVWVNWRGKSLREARYFTHFQPKIVHSNVHSTEKILVKVWWLIEMEPTRSKTSPYIPFDLARFQHDWLVRYLSNRCTHPRQCRDSKVTTLPFSVRWTCAIIDLESL